MMPVILGLPGSLSVATSAKSGGGLINALMPLISDVMGAISKEIGIPSSSFQPDISTFNLQETTAATPQPPKAAPPVAAPAVEILQGASVDGGCLRLPVIIRSRGEEQRLTLNLTMTLESGE